MFKLIGNKILEITTEQLEIVKLIDRHANQFSDNETGAKRLLASAYELMEPFKKVMDTTTGVKMDYLNQNYPGFYRFAKLFELMAEGIASGTIKVPRHH